MHKYGEAANAGIVEREASTGLLNSTTVVQYLRVTKGAFELNRLVSGRKVTIEWHNDTAASRRIIINRNSVTLASNFVINAAAKIIRVRSVGINKSERVLGDMPRYFAKPITHDRGDIDQVLSGNDDGFFIVETTSCLYIRNNTGDRHRTTFIVWKVAAIITATTAE